jgi:glycine/D-amino acid oxidase-like deaminating enzyme
VPGLVALYGMESPGLTSSLAIGDYVAALLADGRAVNTISIPTPGKKI